MHRGATYKRWFSRRNYVSVGADCTIPFEFDRVFMNCEGYGGSPARALLQMAARFRDLRDTEYIVLMNKPAAASSGVLGPTFDGAVKLLYDRRNCIKTVFTRYTRFVEHYDENGLQLSPDWITKAFAHARVERDYNFEIDLFDKCTAKQMNVLFPKKKQSLTEEEKKEEKDKLDEIKDLGKKTKQELLEEKEELFNDLREDENYLGEAEEADRKVKQNDATKRDRMAVSMNAVLKHFDTHGPENDQMIESYEQFVTVQKNLHVIRNIAAVKRLPEVQRALRDYKNLTREPWRLI